MSNKSKERGKKKMIFKKLNNRYVLRKTTFGGAMVFKKKKDE